MTRYEFEDEECRRLLAMSPDEIRAHVAAKGVSPDNVVEEVDRVIACAKVDAYRRRMKITAPTTPRAQ